MTESQTKDFLSQFQRSRDNVAAWPQWMRDCAVVETASFPRLKKRIGENMNSREKAEEIIASLCDRRGFDYWWEGVDEGVQREITADIEAILEVDNG